MSESNLKNFEIFNNFWDKNGWKISPKIAEENYPRFLKEVHQAIEAADNENKEFNPLTFLKKCLLTNNIDLQKLGLVEQNHPAATPSSHQPLKMQLQT